MAYTFPWDVAFPPGAQSADQINEDLQRILVQVQERFVDLLGISFPNDTVTTVTATKLVLKGSVTSKIIPGATSLSFRDTADANDNLVITDAGVVTVSRSDLVVNHTGTSAIIALQGSAGQSRIISLRTGAQNRWQITANSTAEGGANVGSDFAINRYDDTGAFIATPFTIARSSGLVTVGNSLSITTDLTIGNNLIFSAANAKIFPGSTTLVIRDNANTQDNVIISNAGAMTVLSTITSKAAVVADRVGAALDVNFTARGDAGKNRGLIFGTGVLTRWYVFANTTAEGGANAGSDFSIQAYDDAGVSLGAALSIIRSTRVVTLATGLSVGGAGISISAGGISMTGDLVMNTAAARIRPGATSISLRNNANTLDNILITDNGQTTITGSSGIPPLLIDRLDAAAALITHLLIRRNTSTKARIGLDASDQFCIQDAAGANANLTLTDSGNLTLRGSFNPAGLNSSGTINIAITSGTMFTTNSTTNATSDVNQWIFQRGGVGKWRIGVNINGTNSDEFNIYNDSGALTAVRIANTTGAVHIPVSLQVNGGVVITKILSASFTWDPPSVASAAFTSTTVTVTGAALGDPVFFDNQWLNASFEAVTMSAYVSAADTVTVVFKNTSGIAVDLPSKTSRVFVFHV